jgi:hypothetical protein
MNYMKEFLHARARASMHGREPLVADVVFRKLCTRGCRYIYKIDSFFMICVCSNIYSRRASSRDVAIALVEGMC